MIVRGIVGSPNSQGRSAELVQLALQGAKDIGADVEAIFLSDHDLKPCSDCTDLRCHDEGRCIFSDDLPKLSEKIDTSDGLIVASPVYWSDVSNSTRTLFSKKIRMRTQKTNGLPALGMLVAGGSGNGCTEAMRPMYLFFEKLRFRTISSFPVTRYNYTQARDYSYKGGKKIAEMAKNRSKLDPVALQLLNNDLRYRNYSRIDERRLIARLIVDNFEPSTLDERKIKKEWTTEMGRMKNLFSRDQKAEAILILDRIIMEGEKRFA